MKNILSRVVCNAMYLTGMLLASAGIARAAPVTLTVMTAGSGSLQSTPAGINCPGSCSFDFPSGTNITLTAAPAGGSVLANWAGCDTGFGLVCSVDAIAAPRAITATFTTSTVTVPDAPTIVNAIAGNGQARINFTVPANNGGSPVSNYDASCTPGPFTSGGLGSPIIVHGLGNGTPYTCSVSATNAAGTGAASATATVTPGNLPLALVAVNSRKTHGGAGTYDVPVNTAVGLGGAISVEPREIGTGHIVIFEFNGPVNASGTVAAVEYGGSPVNASLGNSTVRAPGLGTPVTLCCGVNVMLPDVADGKRVALSLTGVNGTLNVTANMGFLNGDVNGSGVVSAADIASVKSRANTAVSTDRFRLDANSSGTIDASDVSIVKSRAGRSLTYVPPPPVTPTVTLCYAQGGVVFVTGTNFLAGSTALTVAGFAASLISATATNLSANLPGGVAEGNAAVVITVTGAPASANAGCNIIISTPIALSVEGLVIPLPFSKYANPKPAVHPGLNGANANAGYPAQQNAWAVSPTGLCNNATPAITTVWYHNLDYSGYVGGAASSETFGVGPNQALVYSFIAPPEGTSGGMTMNESTAANFVASFVSISTTPCDFDPTRIGVPFSSPYVGCYNMRNGISNTSYYATNGAPRGFAECKLIPGQRYYLNYRNLDSTIPPTDSCQAIGATKCGGLLTMK